MDRVMFFIDGFNVYHSLDVYDIITKNSKDYYYYKYRKYLWLDFLTLSERFIRKQDSISGVHYFSAYATWKPQSMKRHRILVDALQSRGVNVVMGKFKEKDRHCKKCGGFFKAREEKQTDVNIAIYLFKEAYADNYDTAILMTNDTDLMPEIKIVKGTFPEKKIGVLFPIGRWSTELKHARDFWRKVAKKDLSKSQFPDQVELPTGTILTRPQPWKNQCFPK